ncbi:MAG: type II toxin-antitoxin system VapC family toxin [Burkholderiales bacterium]
MRLVVDASVAVKWFLNATPGEDDADEALAILAGAVAGAHALFQPPHFVAEVAAVLSRLKPDQAPTDVADLQLVGFERCESPAIYASALRLAVRHGQHVFDTLYHAVALLTPDALLVTADRRYFAKAGGEGRIVMLSDFEQEL